MPHARSLVVLSLLLSPVVAVAQRAGEVGPPATGGRAYVAARYLSELETTPASAGVQVTADLDLDGDVDLLIAERPSLAYPTTGVQTWLNGGQGDFQLAHLLALPYSTSDFFEQGLYVFAADLTGDGVPDLAYERKDIYQLVGPSGVLVHPGLGDGSFGVGLVLATNGVVQGFLVGDCDGDGDADLLVHDSNSGTDYLNTLAWWRLEGETFVAGPALLVDAETPLRMQALDLGGDGITDAVAGTFNGYDMLQFFRTEGGAPKLHALVPLPGLLHDINQRQRTGDIDGDGRVDVLMVLDDLGTGQFHVQPILGRATGFVLGTAQVFQNVVFDYTYSRDAVLADWDADGDLDLVSPTFSWLENTGGAHFEPAGRQLSGWTGNGNRSPMNVADVDGDGHLDALAEKSLFRGDGSFPRKSSVPAHDEYLGQLTWTRVEDWEGDGDLDLVGPLQLHLNDGAGNFTARATLITVPGAFDLRLAGWDDFDGDGLQDVVAAVFTYPPFAFDRMKLFTGTPSGTYLESALVPSPAEIPAGLVSGDLDGDGDADILASNGYWANDGTGQFGSAPVAAYVGAPQLALDVDGDADLDVLLRRSGRLELLRNLGALAFALVDLGAFESGAFPSFLDVDQDGDLDLTVVQPVAGLLSVRAQLPGGSFAAALTLAVPGASGALGLVDVDGDERLDLALPRTVSGAVTLRVVSVFPRGHGPSYGARRDWVTRELPLVFGDFDGDGDVEAIGQRTLRNLRFDGPEDGRAQQYGLATVGSGGYEPVLGCEGPTRPGARAGLRLARGLGGASGVLLMGEGRADVLDSGYRRLVEAPQVVRALALDGTPGMPGAGATTVPVRAALALVGRTFTLQAVLVDPGAASGLSATSGLEIRFGDLPIR